MRLMMILGGLFGFIIGVAFSTLQECTWPSIIWRASLTAYLAGILMRWWGRLWIKCLKQAYQERLAQESESETANESNGVSS
jgi:hypothetical protein